MLAQEVQWVSHGTHTKEETTVNYHKAEAKRPTDSQLTKPDFSQSSTHAPGSTAVPARLAKDARHARFDSLLTAHLPALSRVAYRFCGHRETAEELVQETLLRAWKHLDQLRDDQSAKSWIFMILRREHARSFKRQTLATTDIELERLTDGKFENSIDKMALYEAIETLPEKYRNPLVLFAIGGYDIKEIASDLQLKGTTVKTRLFRAREKLREHLAEDRIPSLCV